MSDGLRQQVYSNFSLLATEDLLEIWRTNDRDQWSEITFDVIRGILRERHVELPPQDEPPCQTPRLTPEVVRADPQAQELDPSLQGEFFDEADGFRPDIEASTDQPLRTGRSVGVRGTLRSRHQEDAEMAAPISEQENLAGLGGWLIVVGFGVVLSPLVIIVQFLQTYSGIFANGTWEAMTTPGAETYHPFWGPLLLTEIVVNAGMLLVRLALIFLFFKKKRAFPKWFIGITLFNMIFVFADILAFKAIWPDLEISGADALSSIIPSLIWVMYMIRSKRVKATFVK